MLDSVRSYVRPDEQQFVFIIRTDQGFAIVEVAELWEEPQLLVEGTSYFCYPTVLDHERYATEAEAASIIVTKYEWASDASKSANS